MLAGATLTASAFDFINQSGFSRSGKLILTNNSILNMDYTNVPFLDINGTNVLYSLQTNVNNANITAPPAFRLLSLFTDANGQPAPQMLTVIATPWTNGTRADSVLATNLISVIYQTGIIRSNKNNNPVFVGGLQNNFTFPASNGGCVYRIPVFTNMAYGSSVLKVIGVTNAGVGTAPLGTNWQVEVILSGWTP